MILTWYFTTMTSFLTMDGIGQNIRDIMVAQDIVHCAVKMEKQCTGNRFKPNDLVRIIHAVDVDGKKFLPMYAYYKVISIDEDILHIGIGSIVKYKILNEYVEHYRPTH